MYSRLSSILTIKKGRYNMITVYDSSNYGQTVLFNKAYAELKARQKLNQDELTAGKFLTLDGYFAHMKDLIEIEPSYVLIPSDEEPFKIDANTRKIEVPKNFKQAAVIGDNMCEIITFTIDRYFDYVDLATTQICIQWKTETTEGISHIGLRDLETVSGKIRFGWPLTSVLTEKAGKIHFAVRFFIESNVADSEEKQIVYLLNTSIAEIEVGSGLNLSGNNVKVESGVDDLFAKFVSNSMNPSYPIPAPVTFNPAPGGLNLEKLAKVDVETDTLTLIAKATTSDGGTITYQWYFKEGTTDETDITIPAIKVPEEATPGLFTVKDVYKEAGTVEKLRAGAAKPNEQYYILKSGVVENGVWNIVAIDNEDLNLTDVLYTKFTTLTIPARSEEQLANNAFKKVTGQYWVGATNAVGSDTIEVESEVVIDGVTHKVTYEVPAINASNEEKSNICVVPTPKDLVITKNLPVDVIKANSAAATLTFDLKEDDGNPDRAFSWYYVDDSGLQPKKVNGAWTKNDIDFTNIQNVKNNENYLAQNPGWYYVEVDSELNRDSKNISSQICRVANKPTIPEVALKYKNWANNETEDDDWTDYAPNDSEGTINIINKANGDLISLYVYINPNFSGSQLLSDNLTYTWYYRSEDSDWRQITEADVDSSGNGLVYEQKPDVNGAAITIRVLKNLIDTNYHQFYCVVTNYLADQSIKLDDDTILFTIQ